MKYTLVLALALLSQQGLSTSAQSSFGYKSLKTREAEAAAKQTPPLVTPTTPVQVSGTTIRVQATLNETGKWVTFTFQGKAGRKYRIVSASDFKTPLALWEPVTRVESAGDGTQRVTLPTGIGAKFFRVWQE